MLRAAIPLLFFLTTGCAIAAKVTMILSDEIELSDGKLCVYEHGQRSESVKVAKSALCHHTKTFEANG